MFPIGKQFIYGYNNWDSITCGFPSFQAREAVEMRAQVEKKMAQKEKEKKEESLRLLAQKAREESAGIRRLDGRKHARSLHSCIH